MDGLLTGDAGKGSSTTERRSAASTTVSREYGDGQAKTSTQRANGGDLPLRPDLGFERLTRAGPSFEAQQIEEMRMAKSTIAGLGVERLRELARAGAEVTLKRLRAEIIAIERAFPELALPSRRRAARRAMKRASNRTRRMSAAARKAVSERMKRYWAERRKAKARATK
jgi:hypothetical protein